MQQRDQITDACCTALSKRNAATARIVDTAPGWMLKKWREIEGRGGQPILRKRKHGVSRGGRRRSDPRYRGEMPTVEAPSAAPEEGERKLRFRLIKFQDMRPDWSRHILLMSSCHPPAWFLFGASRKRSSHFGCSTCLFMSPWAGHIAIMPYGKGR